MRVSEEKKTEERASFYPLEDHSASALRNASAVQITTQFWNQVLLFSRAVQLTEASLRAEAAIIIAHFDLC